MANKIVPKITTTPAPIEEVKEPEPVVKIEDKSLDHAIAVTEREEKVIIQPLQQILNHVYDVANGGSAVELRNTVHRVFPDNITDGQQFLTVLRRLRDASEVIFQSANEAYAALLNR